MKKKDKNEKLSQVIDSINEKYGPNSVVLASGSLSQLHKWKLVRNKLSKRYTTQWEELPKIF